jgi:hypothetical protein
VKGKNGKYDFFGVKQQSLTHMVSSSFFLNIFDRAIVSPLFSLQLILTVLLGNILQTYLRHNYTLPNYKLYFNELMYALY